MQPNVVTAHTFWLILQNVMTLSLQLALQLLVNGYHNSVPRMPSAFHHPLVSHDRPSGVVEAQSVHNTKQNKKHVYISMHAQQQSPVLSSENVSSYFIPKWEIAQVELSNIQL